MQRWGAVAALALWIALQAAALGRDPPGWLTGEIGVFVDEGLKTLQARNTVVFGAGAPIPGDQYRGGTGGRAAFLLQWAAFRVLGATPASVRLLTLATAVAMLGALWSLLPAGGRLAVLVVLACDPLVLTFSRVGLLEIPWIALVCLALTAGRWQPSRAFAAGVLFGLGCLVKPQAVLCGPALLVGVWWRPGRRSGGVWLPAGALAAGGVVPLLIGAATSGEGRDPWPLVAGAGPSSLAHLVEVPGAALTGLRWLVTADPVLYVLGMAGIALALAGWRRATAQERFCGLVAAAWLTVGLLGLILSGLSPPPARYVVHLVVPLALGAAVSVGRLASSPSPWARRAVPGLVTAALAWTALSGALVPTGPSTIEVARRALRRLASERSMGKPMLVTGLWAPTLTLGSDLPALVTCLGCRFPPPHGSPANLEVVLAMLRLPDTPARGILVVAADGSGEREGWEQLFRGLGIEPPVAGRLVVGTHQLTVFRVTSAEVG